MPATMTRNYSHAEIPPVNFMPATERRPATCHANAELTADEIEAMVQAAVKKSAAKKREYLEPNKPYIQGRTRVFTEIEIDALCDAMEVAMDSGDRETHLKIRHILPLEADLAESIRDSHGKEWLLDYGRDLTPAEIKFGKGWLDQ
ncbi:hypothetical protein FACS1894139_07840 [Planctomycetales bacterium]|nr:hypothetical protein FACS1894107_09340 [Planctomycetales bacterium]GHS99233.1 hypothetical protein FACS1894108_08820 [Planctomycetales bacterium]GHT04908.1 hypothetical protein FACS1894139_07840 [Planctomycetales bacterium]